MDLSGSWQNQLSSTVFLDADGKGGLTGMIVCASGQFAGRQFPLVGCYDPAPRSPATALAFVVDWSNQGVNGHSVTAWSGQYDEQAEAIVATWILTTETGVGPGDEWHSSLIGQDTFRRDPVSTHATVGPARRSASHPQSPTIWSVGHSTDQLPAPSHKARPLVEAVAPLSDWGGAVASPCGFAGHRCDATLDRRQLAALLVVASPVGDFGNGGQAEAQRVSGLCHRHAGFVEHLPKDPGPNVSRLPLKFTSDLDQRARCFEPLAYRQRAVQKR